MTGLDPRIQKLLDGDLAPQERERLEAEVGSRPAGRRELAAMRRLMQQAKLPAPALPQGFEQRLMARLAVTPAPKPSLWARLRRAWGGPAWMPVAALAGAGTLLVVVGLFAGYEAGVRAGRSTVPAVAVQAPAPERVLVRFAIKAPDARKVEVVGSFNGWGAKGVQLARGGDGAWVASLQLPKGRYEYTFVVDGQRWVPDPSAAQLVDDGFGGQNAVLEL